MADISTDLVAIYDKIKVSAKDGGVDRGFTNGGMGTFKSVMDALQKLKHTSKTKQKDWDAAVSKLEAETAKWVAKDQTSNNPNRGTDEVSIRKRQTAQAIQLSLQTQKQIQQVDSAQDWDTYDSALALAEANARNTKVAAIVALNPPSRIGGPPKKVGNSKGGKSDSYFIKDGNTLTHVFKPQKGENLTSGFPQGGGAPREVLISEFSEGMKQFGFDFKIPKTTVAELNSNSFSIGGHDQSTNQVGVLIDAVPNAKDGREAFEEAMKAGKNAIVDLTNSLDLGDIQDMAILDFITVNLDRNPANVMLQPDANDPSKMRLIPIDAGNLLPPVDYALGDAGFMGTIASFSTSVVELGEPMPEANMTTVLPQSKQPLTDDRIAKIRALDPAAIAKMLKTSDQKRTGAMAGKVGDDTFELVEHSVAFLKYVAALDPKVSVNQIGKLYGINEGFTEFQNTRAALIKAAKQNNTQPDFSSLQAIVDKAAIEARRLTQEELDTAEYVKLGGDDKLNALGWHPLRDNLALATKLDAVKTNKQNPAKIAARDELLAKLKPTSTELSPDFQTKFVGEQYEDLLKLRTLREEVETINSFPNGTVQQALDLLKKFGGTPTTSTESSLSQKEKAAILGKWKEFLSYGGENILNECVALIGGLQRITGNTLPDTMFTSINTVLKNFMVLKKIEKKLGNTLLSEYPKLQAAFQSKTIVDKTMHSSIVGVEFSTLIPLFEFWADYKDSQAFRDHNQIIAKSGANPPTNIKDFMRFVTTNAVADLETSIGDANDLNNWFSNVAKQLIERQIQDSFLKEPYANASVSAKAELFKHWDRIKSLPAFLKYNELVDSKKLKRVGLFSELVDQVTEFKG